MKHAKQQDSEACELLEIQIYIVICFTVFHCCFHPRKWSMLHADWLSFGCGWLRHQLYHIVGYYVLICTCIPCFLRFLANISCLSISWVGLKNLRFFATAEPLLLCRGLPLPHSHRRTTAPRIQTMRCMIWSWTSRTFQWWTSITAKPVYGSKNGWLLVYDCHLL